MPKLPDFEALGDFRQGGRTAAPLRAAATELTLSKATVSKAVGRLEDRLGARLFNRTSRRLALTELRQDAGGEGRAIAGGRRSARERGAGAVGDTARAGTAGRCR